ncbi:MULTISPECIES: hypothetical protein [Phyllobacterium]|uniref:hypothetical protein n=1 Tax=Phyllobacterium TaxID=28100 RepID=UPI001CC9822B|nr:MULTISPECIES: hypothetical protein [unclassified Phyllobacterium]MBZ9600409.1 hypothetical protein [Phyllobacterium sp. KW56]
MGEGSSRIHISIFKSMKFAVVSVLFFISSGDISMSSELVKGPLPDGYQRPGVVSVSPAALKQAEDFLEAVRQLRPDEEWIAVFEWYTAQSYINKGETIEHDLGPGLGLGAAERRELPEEAIQSHGDSKFAVQIPAEILEKSVERLIDLDENAQLILRN